MKKFSKVLSLLLVFAMIVPGIAQAATVDAEEAAVVTRISGGNRYQTAANVSNQKFGKSKTVVLASGENWPDALAGTALAGVEGAPILLTAARRLHPDTKAELISLGAEKVIIVGGETVIPAAVADELKAMGLTVDRKEGLKREDTAVAAAKGMTSKTAIIANGYESFADALSAGAYAGMNGMPILFVRQNSVPAGTLEGLKALGIENVIIAGGTSAVSAKVQSELAAYNPTRIYGEDREKTSLAFAEKFADNKEVIIANGYDYADALAGAALGAKIGAPVVLVNTNSMKTVVKEFIKENADKNHTVIGGTSAVSNNVVSDIEEIIAPVESEFKVVSVSAINAKELEVKFSKPVKESSVVTTTAGVTNINASTFSQNGTPLTGNVASLSEDGKTLTIEAASTWEGTYLFEVAKDKVVSKDDQKLPAYATMISYEDKVAPTFVSATRENASKTVATFSEPIKSKGTITAKLEDGTDVSSVVSTNTDIDGNDLVFNLGTAGIAEGKKVNITITGLTDFADNLVNPNPVTLTVQRGEKDGVAPEVTSITPVNAKKFEIKFSEEIMELVIGDIEVGGTALVSPGATLTQDKTDKTKYIVTVDTVLVDLQTISIDAGAYTDLSGEPGKAASKIVNFGKDEVKPTLTNAVVAKNKDGAEVLTLTFSEDVTLLASGPVSFSATQVKDYVTTAVTLTVQDTKIEPVTGDATKLEILLSDVTIAAGTLVKDAKYTVTLPASLVKDTSNNPNLVKADAFTFTRGTDADTTKPQIDKSIDSAETGNYVKDNGILVVPNNQFKVKFTGDVDNATVVNKANYSVSGATVEGVSLASDGTVTVTLAKDSNTYTGLRNVTISGIKTKAGVAMDAYTTQEYFQENVRPTVTKAEVTKITSATSTEVTLTFSEAVVSGSVDDFELFIDGDKVDTTVTTAAGSNANQLVVTIDQELTADNFAKGVQLKATDGLDIADTVGNVLNITAPIDLKLN